MRKFFILLLLLICVAVGYLTYAHFSGGKVYTFGLPIGGERAVVKARVANFFEQIKFKNINGLKDFFASSVSKEDLILYVSKILGSSSDQMELDKYMVEEIELDSLDKRARVRVNLFGKNLITNQPFTLERLVFLYSSHQAWVIDTALLSL